MTMSTPNNTNGVRARQAFPQPVDYASSVFEPVAEQIRTMQRTAGTLVASGFECASSMFFEPLAEQLRAMPRIACALLGVADFDPSKDNRWPQVELYQKEDAYVIEARVPGFKRDEIQIACADNRITISGSERRTAEGPVHYSEFRHGDFCRTITLPSAELDLEKVSAKLEDGLLTVTLPTPSHSAVKRVPVTV
jgi:HSP20 family protein